MYLAFLDLHNVGHLNYIYDDYSPNIPKFTYN